MTWKVTWGRLISHSPTKQQSITSISIEAELSRISDKISKIGRDFFCQYKEITLKLSIPYQDSANTEKSAENVKASSEEWANHFSIRIFQTTDLIQKKKLWLSVVQSGK